jgi:ketosteroid isomerase-like protein
VWRVALDVGVNHPQPQEAETEIRTYIPDSPLLQPESASTDLDEVQSDFTESLRDDEADAVIDHASDDVRVYRRDQLPAVEKTAAKKMLAEEDAKTSRAPFGAGTSHPIDFSYEYGEYTSESDKVTQRGIYLTIWRLESDGGWKIALDLQKSAPAEKKP